MSQKGTVQKTFFQDARQPSKWEERGRPEVEPLARGQGGLHRPLERAKAEDHLLVGQLRDLAKGGSARARGRGFVSRHP